MYLKRGLLLLRTIHALCAIFFMSVRHVIASTKPIFFLLQHTLHSTIATL